MDVERSSLRLQLRHFGAARCEILGANLGVLLPGGDPIAEVVDSPAKLVTLLPELEPGGIGEHRRTVAHERSSAPTVVRWLPVCNTRTSPIRSGGGAGEFTSPLPPGEPTTMAVNPGTASASRLASPRPMAARANKAWAPLFFKASIPRVMTSGAGVVAIGTEATPDLSAAVTPRIPRRSPFTFVITHPEKVGWAPRVVGTRLFGRVGDQHRRAAGRDQVRELRSPSAHSFAPGVNAASPSVFNDAAIVSALATS